MRINGLRLVNFRQHADTHVEFDGGLTGIIGPNGSGKTTLLEAIAWALYGNSAARGNRDTIRHNRAGPRSAVRVELDFSLGGHRYRVVRGLTSAELYLDGGQQPIANSITGVTDLLQRRLGMTRGEFFNTYFTGQKELNVMAAMGPSERAQFLSRVLGYERLRTAQTLVRDRRRLITAEVSGVRSAMPDPDAVRRAHADAERHVGETAVRAAELDRRRERTAARLAVLAPRWESAQVERERVQRLDAELRVAEGEETALVRDAERLAREGAEVAAARAELERVTGELAPFREVAAELQRFDSLCREEGRRQTLIEHERLVRDEIDRITERRAKIETAPQLETEIAAELEQKRAEVETTQHDLEAKRTEWVRDRQEAETKRQALRQQYAEVKEQRDRLASLGPDGPCPTCTRPLGKNYQTVLDLLDEQLDTVQVDGRYFKDRLEQLEEMPAEVTRLDERRRALTHDVAALERKLTKVQLAVQELATVGRELATREERLAKVQRDLLAIPAGYDAARHELLKREVARLTPLDQRAARLGALVEREPQLRREGERVDGELARVRERLAGARERRAELTTSEPEYQALRAEHDAAAAEARGAELAAVAARGEEASARAGMESAARSLAELARMQERLDALQADKRLHDELDRAYSDLRTDLNFALRPELSELASAFLTELTDARYAELELDDQYNVVVLEDGMPKPVISGGEEDLANLVLRLAISQMIAERAGQAFSLLILDEVFGSLDEARRRNVVELLRRLHDRFEQVILITHIESVREGLDRVISVRYDEERGTSVVAQGEGGAGEESGDLPGASNDDSAFEMLEAGD
jgi:exonuclease SbcC